MDNKVGALLFIKRVKNMLQREVLMAAGSPRWAGPASLWPVAEKGKVTSLPICQHLLVQFFWVEARGSLVATHRRNSLLQRERSAKWDKASLSVTLVDALPHGNRKKRKSGFAPTFPERFLFQPVGLSYKTWCKNGHSFASLNEAAGNGVSCFQTLESIHPMPSAHPTLRLRLARAVMSTHWVKFVWTINYLNATLLQV